MGTKKLTGMIAMPAAVIHHRHFESTTTLSHNSTSLGGIEVQDRRGRSVELPDAGTDGSPARRWASRTDASDGGSKPPAQGTFVE
jgi:hypothetical protein